MNPATTETVQARILVVDDHPFMRQGIVDFLNGEPDLTVCAESTSTGAGARVSCTIALG